MSAYGPGGEKTADEIRRLWNGLIECVGSFLRNVNWWLLLETSMQEWAVN